MLSLKHSISSILSWAFYSEHFISRQTQLIMNSNFDFFSSEILETFSSESESESESDSEVWWSKLLHKQCCQIQTLQFIAERIYTKIAEVIEKSLSTIFHVCMWSITSWCKFKRINVMIMILNSVRSWLMIVWDCYWRKLLYIHENSPDYERFIVPAYCEKTSRLHESFKEKKIILLRAKLWCLCRIQDIVQEKKSIEEMTSILIHHMW